MKRALGAVLLATAGCTGAAPAASLLGITDYQISETSTELEITGVDGAGARVAHLTLNLGRFVSANDDRTVDGRQITVEVGGQQAKHESEGAKALKLPLFRETEKTPLNLFLLEPRVKSVLARWGVHFEETGMSPLVRRPPGGAPAAAEVPRWTCTYARSPSCGDTSCAESNNFFDLGGDASCTAGTTQDVCCGGTHAAVERACGLGAGNPCGAEGVNGCAICWAFGYSNSCTASSGAGYTDTCSPNQFDTWTLGAEYISISYN